MQVYTIDKRKTEGNTDTYGKQRNEKSTLCTACREQDPFFRLYLFQRDGEQAIAGS